MQESIKVDLKENANYYLLGDEHIGNAATSFKKIKEAVEIIRKDKYAHWGHMGDALESIHLGDKRFDPDIHRGKDALLNFQINKWVELHKPILKRCDFILDGNHEEKDIWSFNPAQQMSKEGGGHIAWGGRTIVVELNGIKLFCTHGDRTVNSRAGDAFQRETNDCIAIKRLLRDLRSDCHVMAMGHIHKLRIHPPVKKINLLTEKVASGEDLDESYACDYQTSDGSFHEDARWFCSTGSFMKGYIYGATTYVEKKMYPPTELGFIKISIKKGQVDNVEKIIL